MPVRPDTEALNAVAAVARAAGEKIMAVYRTDFAVESKDDDSPVTAADRAAEDLILDALAGPLGMGFPVVGEESFAEGRVPDVKGTPFWLVDPLDGTKEFVKRNGEFTVNIALIADGRPALGVVYAPVLDQMFGAVESHAFAETAGRPRRAIRARQAPATGLVALISRSHMTPEAEDVLKNYKITERVTAGSSLKFCRVAEGVADIYPRVGRTMEWDTAAGHAVLGFAGGRVVDLNGRDIVYGKSGFENPPFVALGANVPFPRG